MFKKENLYKAFRKVSTLMSADSRIVKFTVSGSTLKLEANSEIGTAKEEVEVEYTGPDVELKFNGKFLNDLLANTEGEYVMGKIPKSDGVCVFIDNKASRNISLIMPIRTT